MYKIRKDHVSVYVFVDTVYFVFVFVFYYDKTHTKDSVLYKAWVSKLINTMSSTSFHLNRTIIGTKYLTI